MKKLVARLLAMLLISPMVVTFAAGSSLAQVPSPGWWNGNCDDNNSPGSRPLGASFDGVVVCGPGTLQGGSDHLVRFYPGAFGEYEWECVELAMRFMYQVFGVHPYSADGVDVVSNYSTTDGGGLSKVANGAVGQAPEPGDVISFSSPTNSAGHVAVVASSSVDANGNGSITLITQNDTSNGWRTLAVSGWRVAGFGSETPYGWLHDPQGRGGGGTTFANGTFVSFGGNVFRMAGGAPLYVSSWSVFGGSQPTTALTAAQWSALRSRPSNGTDIVAAGVGTVYRIVGGAPTVVTSCTIGTTNFCADAVPVDPYAISSLDHLSAVPSNGTDVALALDTGGTGSVYRMAGGAPLVVSSCTIGTTNFCADTVAIDPYALAHLNHMNSVPSGGTDVAVALDTGGTGSVYRMAGGAPLVVSSCTIGTTNFCADTVAIDPYALAHLDHMNSVPSDGTDVALAVDNGGTGSVYRIAGGAPFVTSSCTVAAVNFCNDAVPIDPYAISHRDHMGANPNPGTLVRGVPSGKSWTFDGHCRSASSTVSGSVVVADSGINQYDACAVPRIVPTSRPSVKGTPRVGVRLTATAGTWSAVGSYSYQWLANGSSVGRATASSYTPSAGMKGRRISVRVTATRSGYLAGTATSSQTSVVAAGIIANTAKPTIAGTRKVGKTLTASPGTWSVTGLTVRYEWLRDGNAISHATSKAYKLIKASKGHRISIKITVSRAGYATAAKTSSPTTKIA